MTWIIASLIMFISSVIMYLLVRKSQLVKINNRLINIAMFLIPCLLYIPLSYYQHLTFLLSLKHLLIIFIASFFFSYLANVFSLTSIKLAPNPGYSLIISKSYMCQILAILMPSMRHRYP